MGEMSARRRLETIRGFAAGSGPARTLRILRPEAFDRDPARTFPVLLLTDGQNMLDVDAAIEPAWGVDSCMDRLVAEGVVEPRLVVAMDHLAEHRLTDYCPWPDRHVPGPAHGARWVELVAAQLLPFLERNHRARIGPDDVCVIGSSLGGLIALYAGLVRPDRFGRVGALSPSAMWADFKLLDEWRRRDPGPDRIYVDAGEHETVDASGFVMRYGPAATKLGQHLRELGYSEDELRVVIDPEGKHHESDWRRRLPDALTWLLG